MPRPLSRALEDHVVEWRRAPAWPIEWSRVFGRRGPLALEIGFGNGEFLVDWARAHPERDHLGIELSWTAATHLFRRLDAAGVRNARALLVDAEVALRNLFETETLAEVALNHPCPWPKERHHARRLFDPAGLALLADRMRTGARLTFVTDHAEYAAWFAQVLRGQDALVSCHAGAETDAIPGRRPTKYERKAMAAGIAIHYFEWRKERSPYSSAGGSAGAPRSLSLAHDDMLSLTLRGAFDASSLFAEPSDDRGEAHRETHEGEEVVVRLGPVWRRPDRAQWLVEVLVVEGRLRQEFGVQAVARGEKELLVKLSDLGRPHPTYGVKRAVFCVARELAKRHGLQIAHDNLGAAARTPIEPARGT